MSRRASSYQKKHVEWLWPGHFALGMLGLIDGDPSRGKSQLIAYMAGRITTGRPWPDGSPCPIGGVVLVGAEDPIEEVVIPRLEAAGANLERVTILPAPGDDPIRLPESIAYLEQEIRAVDARMLSFDPIMSYLTGLTNPNSDKDVRQALTPLNDVLVRNRCACEMLRHFNKTDKVSQALYRGMASIAFGALARTGFAVAKDPDSPGGFIFATTKNNVAMYPPSLKYRIVEVDLGDGFKTSRIEWQGASHRTAEELVTAFGAQASKTSEAEDLLSQWLADGPILSDVLLERAKEAAISFITYRRAKDTLRCKAGQHRGRWYSWLPEHDRLWELMRAQAAVTTAWERPLAQEPDAHLVIPPSEIAGLSTTVVWERPLAQEPDAHLEDPLARARARVVNFDEHLNLDDEHLTDGEEPDAQMLISEVDRQDLAADQLDQIYRDAVFEVGSEEAWA